MKTLFNFSKGEWSAALSLLLLSIMAIYFSFFYNFKHPGTLDASPYRQEIVAFYDDQQRLSDSIERVKQEKIKLRQERYYYDRNFTYDDFNTTQDSIPKKKQKLYAIVKVDLNNCDTTDIMNIPQFGSKRAQKIIEYRNQLGGFYSLKQLQEIYIIQNVALSYIEQYFVVDAKSIKQININKASYKELIQHPYFDAYLTKTILNYRQKNGNIKDIKELQKITSAYNELIEKLTPYIAF